jgi:SPP1 family predicted phage head-tail adaptor
VQASTTIAAGELRHRISILRMNVTQDSFGGWQIGDDSIFSADVPAKIETLTGRELYAAQQKVSEVTHKITIRWQPGILAKMNVLWSDEGNRFFQIEDRQDPDGRRIRLELLCIERDDSARNA